MKIYVKLPNEDKLTLVGEGETTLYFVDDYFRYSDSVRFTEREFKEIMEQGGTRIVTKNNSIETTNHRFIDGVEVK